MITLQSKGLPRSTDEGLSKDNGGTEGEEDDEKRTGKPLANAGANKFAALMEVGDSSD